MLQPPQRYCTARGITVQRVGAFTWHHHCTACGCMRVASLYSVWVQARGITMPSDDPQDLFNILRAGGVPGCEDPDARARVACACCPSTPRYSLSAFAHAAHRIAPNHSAHVTALRVAVWSVWFFLSFWLNDFFSVCLNGQISEEKE